MLHFYRFAEDVPVPVPARETYHQREPGKGWPEECPPLRAANAFGWDLLSTTDLVFRRKDDAWKIDAPRDLESDWLYGASTVTGGKTVDEAETVEEGAPLVQRNAWFWDEDQELPHRVSGDVYRKISHQVKVSTYLFMFTDPNELLYLCEIPNRKRPYRAVNVLLDTDWYPASYPWHCVLELDDRCDEVKIPKGEPICRLFLVRRDSYFAQEMSTPEFERYFQRGQDWLQRYGRGDSAEMKDITRTYVKQQRLSSFSVIV